MNKAVISTGGKQYLVSEGDVIKVEKLSQAIGESVVFDSVLLATTDTDTKIGQPLLDGATVEAKIVRATKAKKVIGVKMKAKKRYIRYFGHKQRLSEIQITKISL